MAVGGVLAVGATVHDAVAAWGFVAVGTAVAGWLWLAAISRNTRGASVTTSAVASRAPDFWRFAAPRALGAALQTSLLWLDALRFGALRGPAKRGSIRPRSVPVGRHGRP